MNKDQKNILYKALNDPKITIYFVPSANLKDKVSRDSDPILSKLSSGMKAAILSCTDGIGINLDPSLVLKFIDQTIDNNNKYWLSMGDIKILGYGDVF